MLKSRQTIIADNGEVAAAQTQSCRNAAAMKSRPRIALLSNPKSTGNLAQL